MLNEHQVDSIFPKGRSWLRRIPLLILLCVEIIRNKSSEMGPDHAECAEAPEELQPAVRASEDCILVYQPVAEN
jgi:hypothetical protein